MGTINFIKKSFSKPAFPSVIILVFLLISLFQYQRFFIRYFYGMYEQQQYVSIYLIGTFIAYRAVFAYPIIFVNIICIVLVFRYYAGIVKRRVLRQKNSTIKELYMSLLGVQYEDIDAQYATSKAIFEKMKTNKKCKYISLLSALKDLMRFMLAKGEIDFLHSIGIITSVEFEMGSYKYVTKNLREIISYAEKGMDYPELSPKDMQLVQAIELAIETDNHNLGLSSLKQLSSSLYEKEERLHEQNINEKNAKIWTTVGIVLTIFFGILSFVQAVI